MNITTEQTGEELNSIFNSKNVPSHWVLREVRDETILAGDVVATSFLGVLALQRVEEDTTREDMYYTYDVDVIGQWRRVG